MLENSIEPIESGKEHGERFFISFLCGCEAAAVDALIDVGINEVIDGIDLASEFRRIEIDLAISYGVEFELSIRMISADS